MAFEWGRLVLLITGAAYLCLAATLVAADPRRQAARVFAALLAVRGSAILLPQLSSDPAWIRAALATQPYFTLAIIPLVLCCMAVFPRSHAPMRNAGWWAIVAVVVLDAAYAADHALFHMVAAGPAPNEALQAGPGLHYASIGPLAVLGAAAVPLMAVAALHFAVRYRNEAEGPDGKVLLLVAGGFMAGALFDAASRALSLADLLDSPQGYPWLPWGWATAVLPALAGIPALIAFAVVASGRADEPRPESRTEKAVLVLGAFALASGLVRLVLPASSDPGGHPLVLVLLGISRLAMPILLSYALLLQRTRSHPSPQEAIAWVTASSLVALSTAVAGSVAALRFGAPGTILVAAGVAAAGVVAARPLLRLGRRLGAPAPVPQGPAR